MSKNSYLRAINTDEFLFERYQEIYDMAKIRNETTIMMLASDRQAELLGVSFNETQEDYECDE